MSNRSTNEREQREEEVTSIDKMKCPVDDEVYDAIMETCPTHDVPLERIDPEEDQHLL
jgi:hypothetical protein